MENAQPEGHIERDGPRYFIDVPIPMRIMQDPVVTPDGTIMERSLWEQMVRENPSLAPRPRTFVKYTFE